MLKLFGLTSSAHGPHGEGEPKWMPAPDKVARARIKMERQGIVHGLTRGPVAPVVSPGESAWLWWIAATLWVLLWPGLITLRLTSDRLPWLPWWLPLLLAPVHMALLLVPVRLDELSASRDTLRKRFGRLYTLAQILALEPGEFEAWAAMLFQLMGYRVQIAAQVGDHGIDLEVSNGTVQRGLVQCKRYRGTVGEPIVRDLYGTMMHENADNGWLVTTGAISRQAREWAIGKPIELLDGQTLVALARRYR